MKRILSIILCICLLFAPGCGADRTRSYANFYYYRMDTGYGSSDGVLAPELRELSMDENGLDQVLEAYLQGPQTKGLESPLPSGIKLLGWEISEDTLTLAFDETLAALTGIELTVSAGALARTFLELTNTHTLVLTANGSLLDGATALTISLDNISLYDDTPDRMHGEATVYYADSRRRYLIGKTVTVNLTDPEQIPAYLLEQLVAAPSGSGLSSPLPAGTRIRSVTVEDGLCTVDLTDEFEHCRFYARSAQLLSLMCIVNTLTELEQIDRVEFHVEGNLLIRYGSISIPEPLVRDERLTGPVRTALGESDASLYLVHSAEGGLLKIPVRIRRTNAVSQEELLIRALLTDTGLNGISSRIPQGTTLNSIRVENGICHVDLSIGYLGSSGDPLWASRAIAATLCNLDGINSVVITVDGTVPENVEPGILGPISPESDWFL